MGHMKRIGVLFVVLAVVLTGIGVGVAHWTDALFIEGTVETGKVDTKFACQWTFDNETGPLYAGTSEPAKVYRYDGGMMWSDISGDSFINEFAVLDLEEYDCHLYASTMSTDEPLDGIGRVWRYDGGQTWTLVGDGMDDQVCDIEVYNGRLYAGTAWENMKLYRYNGAPLDWTLVVDEPYYGTRALYVTHGLLLMGGIGYDDFAHIDAAEVFTYDLYGGGSCIYDYEDYCGSVWAAAYVGRLWRSPDAVTWDVVLDYYDGNMWEVEVYQGELYMSYGNGELAVYPNAGLPVWTAPDGIISMTTDGHLLYCGIGGEAGAGYDSEPHTGTGYVYSWDGSAANLISGPMGVGVQVLYVGTECYPYEEVKDVGNAWCEILDDGKTILVTVENGYPCYEATMWYTIANVGTVPVHIQDIVVDNPNPITVEVTGIAPGTQIHPISEPGVVPTPGDLHIHVLQEAEQGAWYTFTVTINAVQWNGDQF